MKKGLLILFLIFSIISLADNSGGYLQCTDYYCNRLADAGKYIWIASNKGLIRYEKISGKCEFYTTKVSFPEMTTFTCVYTDKENNLWFGTKEYDIYKYNGNNSIIYPGKFTFKENHWYAMAFDSNNDPAISNIVFYFFYKNDNREQENMLYGSIDLAGPIACIMDMEYDSKGVLWMAVEQRHRNYCLMGTFSNQPFKTLAGNVSTSLAIDKDDNIWLTCDDGIHYYNPATQINTHFDFESHPEIPNAFYTSCEIDDKGNVWFVSSHYLLKYDGNVFSYYNCYGFDEARSILCDGEIIWIYTNNDDMFRFENEKFSHVNIGEALSGIANNEQKYRPFTVNYDRNGEIRIRGEREITRVDVYSLSGLLVSSSAFNGQRNVALKNRKLFSANEIYILKIRHDQGETAVKTVVQ